MKRRHLILLLGGGASGILTVGTDAFSSMEAERGVAVTVARDRNAYVGYRSNDRTLPADLNNGEPVALVTVTNQFKQEIKITDVIIEDGETSFGEPQIPNDRLTPGESATVTAEPQLEPGERTTVAVTGRVQGTGVAAEVFGGTAQREFTVSRESSQETGNDEN